MNKIGGFFTFDTLNERENNFFQNLCPVEGDIRFLMSGRCAIYYALEDLKLTDKKQVAYVPIYTCETVLDPFVKAGYKLVFYDIDKDMKPIFDYSVINQISVISICGYYGFCNYDRDFVQACSDKGIKVIEDTTHSIFSSNGIDPRCDYIVGSLRKWIGVPSGGFAIKTSGTFSLPLMNPDETHISMRSHSMAVKKTISEDPSNHSEQELIDANAVFWDAEMMLRKIFDSYSSDDNSIFIMKHFDVKSLIEKRRSNYQYLLDNMVPNAEIKIVFPILTKDAVPSHFTIYTDDRTKTQEFLLENGIQTTAYWPKGPLINLEGHKDAAYIYDHVLSIPCDQRYDLNDMQHICDILEKLPKS